MFQYESCLPEGGVKKKESQKSKSETNCSRNYDQNRNPICQQELTSSNPTHSRHLAAKNASKFPFHRARTRNLQTPAAEICSTPSPNRSSSLSLSRSAAAYKENRSLS
ncbi:hypothetical protein Droror1_Dr00007594 [Drosera rotundifolia]